MELEGDRACLPIISVLGGAKIRQDFFWHFYYAHVIFPSNFWVCHMVRPPLLFGCLLSSHLRVARCTFLFTLRLAGRGTAFGQGILQHWQGGFAGTFLVLCGTVYGRMSSAFFFFFLRTRWGVAPLWNCITGGFFIQWDA